MYPTCPYCRRVRCCLQWHGMCKSCEFWNGIEYIGI
ncbi:glutathione S-transferase N-terminal domain-containing protein [Sphaerisporangium corydalis]|uniref:Glutathione S-transferase N-terminal domain-containing protein n=1 Tax=Sphaerisporangium corydalis TaxID=1441875 RepID=A0ABV9ELQ2_9ACTN